MAENNEEHETLYTLTDVKRETGISLPTLQKYKKNHQDRIPSVGEGRTQKYPPEALEVFKQLKKENLKKRGRPRKKKKDEDKKESKASKKAESKKDEGEELLSLKKIEELTGISYPTLMRYTKTSLPRIPHKGKGRKRRYLPEAVGVFKTLYEESKRGRRKKSTPSKPSAKKAKKASPATAGDGDLGRVLDEIRELQKAQRDLQRHVEKLEKEIGKPLKGTFRRDA